jgi:hypothetical protein
MRQNAENAEKMRFPSENNAFPCPQSSPKRPVRKRFWGHFGARISDAAFSDDA